MDLNHRDDVVNALNQIRETALDRKKYRKLLIIDLENVDVISPEVALMLLAEVDRARGVPRDYIRLITGNYPKNENVGSRLAEIGYFKYFEIPDPPVAAISTIEYLKVKF